MTGLEFIVYAGYEPEHHLLYLLGKYLDTGVHFAQFPNAAAVDGEGRDLSENFDEPAGFQEYVLEYGEVQ